MAGGQEREWALWSKQSPHYHAIPAHSTSGGNDSTSDMNSVPGPNCQGKWPVPGAYFFCNELQDSDFGFGSDFSYQESQQGVAGKSLGLKPEDSGSNPSSTPYWLSHLWQSPI